MAPFVKKIGKYALLVVIAFGIAWGLLFAALHGYKALKSIVRDAPPAQQPAATTTAPAPTSREESSFERWLKGENEELKRRIAICEGKGKGTKPKPAQSKWHNMAPPKKDAPVPPATQQEAKPAPAVPAPQVTVNVDNHVRVDQKAERDVDFYGGERRTVERRSRRVEYDDEYYDDAPRVIVRPRVVFREPYYPYRPNYYLNSCPPRQEYYYHYYDSGPRYESNPYHGPSGPVGGPQHGPTPGYRGSPQHGPTPGMAGGGPTGGPTGGPRGGPVGGGFRTGGQR